MPQRGFFVGNAKKALKMMLVLALLAYPVGIQADTTPLNVSVSAVANGTVPAASTSATGATTAPAPLANHGAALQAAAASIPVPTAIKTVWVTAYTSAPDETSDHPLITASGGMVRDGVVAANFLPFGTKIQIPSLFGSKIFVVEDRTSQRFSGRVDIWMPTVNQALYFGIQHAEIVVLDQSLAMK